ncbi:hypothetical protein NYP18_09095 [Corynebacterium sp. YIM 101645]|uniref:Uncharacterized protein n=1 Tax=Corynebacterium lemuris TaxID=1859292 RepID=A0ABT2FX51_9CORY|nr:hypothetical protein [Corynebacterium lemuris]MCS5479815.1 hypothetical protein [Corynebacterium lemuris]
MSREEARVIVEQAWAKAEARVMSWWPWRTKFMRRLLEKEVGNDE